MSENRTKCYVCNQHAEECHCDDEPEAPAPNCDSSTQADSTSETPRTDAIDSNRADAGSMGAYFMMRDLAWKLERELAKATKERDEVTKDRTEMADELEKCTVTMGKGMDAIDRLEQQLAKATEALERIAKGKYANHEWLIDQAKQALTEIKENRGEQP